jgi:hypothetical protein
VQGTKEIKAELNYYLFYFMLHQRKDLIQKEPQQIDLNFFGGSAVEKKKSLEPPKH